MALYVAEQRESLLFFDYRIDAQVVDENFGHPRAKRLLEDDAVDVHTARIKLGWFQ